MYSLDYVEFSVPQIFDWHAASDAQRLASAYIQSKKTLIRYAELWIVQKVVRIRIARIEDTERNDTHCI